jgi:hypothetical protein
MVIILINKPTCALAFIKAKACLWLKVKNKLMFYSFSELKAPFIKRFSKKKLLRPVKLKTRFESLPIG